MTNRSRLTFGDRYAGVFWTTSQADTEVLRGVALESGAVSWTVYEGVSFALMVLIGDQHPETITRILNECHRRMTGSSLLAALLSKNSAPPPTDCYLIFDHIGNLSDAAMSQWLDLPQGLSLLDPATDRLYLIATCRMSLDLLRQLPASVTVKAGLVFLDHLEGARQPPAEPFKFYDPLASQIAEVVGRSSVGLNERLRALQVLWSEALGDPPPRELDEARRVLANALSTIHELGRSGDKSSVIALVDATRDWLERAYSTTSRLSLALHQYRQSPDAWAVPQSYSESVSRLTLRASKRLLQELGARADLKCMPIPMFGPRFSAIPEAFGQVAAGTDKIDLGDLPPIVQVTLPHSCHSRMGALPAVGFVFARLYSDTSQVLQQVLRDHADSRTDTISSLLRSVFDDRASRDSLAGLETRVKEVQWATIISADIIACSLCGPAYVYAMARFTGFSLNSFVTQNDSVIRRPASVPPFAKRLQICLEYLNGLGFDFLFQSEYLTASTSKDSISFAKAIREDVPQMYSPEEHMWVLSKCKPALASGRAVGATPVQVLNALWDAVARKDTYVNEIALVASLISPERYADADVGGDINPDEGPTPWAVR